ncbi:aquaporin family protein [Aureibaculum algae]|uniref:Aquaporin family protein n=2 Tax=Aureibaculum TaxID=2706948 RepID=A0A5B7TNX8_9FLAO|nr:MULTISPECIES: MIP/aquaporin family protein [Aureibaculum]MBJ2174157.1 aquaporin family protein [Aureibaculum flavum]QCX36894.1 aquaporin family protein [Aureibaculum algae]
MTPFVAEIIGTFFLILLGGGVVANVVLEKTKSNDQGWMVITTAWGLAVFVGVVVAGPYSGAHLNPAVSIGLAVAGKFEWNLIPLYALGQFIGAMLGALGVWLIYKDHFEVTEDGEAKRAIFCTAPAIRNPKSNIISEIIGTFVLVFVVLYFTNASLTETETPIGLGSLGALPVAFLVWVIGLSLGGTTGYAINPARDLGPRIIHAILPIKNKASNDWGYAWIPVVGPIIGASLAGLLMLVLSASL